MITTIKDTNSAEIAKAIRSARQNLGAASGMVFTLLVPTPPADYDAVFDACVEAGREHPSRIVIATAGSAKATRLDAELHLGESVPGEILALKFHGELIDQQDSTILPLLLPDSPVIAWWPGVGPEHPADDPLGRLAARRITDAMSDEHPLQDLLRRAGNLEAGDTDLTWTRLTPWRAQLAAALDHVAAPVAGATVQAAKENAAGLLLAAWLSSALGIAATFEESPGPGITEVTLDTEAGMIRVSRADGAMATIETPSSPTRAVALRRREVSALLTEELRRLDSDPVFADAMRVLKDRYSHLASRNDG